MEENKGDFKNGTAAFIMAHWLVDDDRAQRFLDEAIRSVVDQTDPNWILIIVDDASTRPAALAHLKEIEQQLGEKVQVLYSHEHIGPGPARNLGIRAAAERGSPFVLFIDDDDRSDPKRLELTRAAFCAQQDVNVVYTGFDVIDESGRIVPEEQLCASVREILDGHKHCVVDGPNAWIRIGTEKNYTNLPSCTAVRTALALAEPFPRGTVSEDAHTWFRYAAHPGRFVFLREIKNQYRICSGTASRARSLNQSFYAQKAQMDSAGFEKAVEIADGYGLVDPAQVEQIRARFYVRLALSMLRGPDESEAARCMRCAFSVSADAAAEAITTLEAEAEEKEKLMKITAY